MSDDDKVVPLKLVKKVEEEKEDLPTLREALQEVLDTMDDAIGDAPVYALAIFGQTEQGGYHNVPIFQSEYEVLGMIDHHKHLILEHYF